MMDYVRLVDDPETRVELTQGPIGGLTLRICTPDREQEIELDARTVDNLITLLTPF